LCVGSQYALPAADGSAGQIMCTDGSGALAFATASAGVTLAGSTNNTVATVTGANALEGEANLTFDGSVLSVTGAVTMANAAGPTIVNEAATASNPTLIPNKAEVDTGFGWGAADTLTAITGGSQRMAIGGATGYVGIGTAATSSGWVVAPLTITGNNGNAAFTHLALTNDDVPSSGETGQTADLMFRFSDNSGSQYDAARIGGYKERDYVGNADYDSGLTFSASNHAADFSGGLFEAMRIDSAGKVGIGNVAPSSYSDSSGTSLVIGTNSATDGLSIITATDGAGRIAFGDGNGDPGEWQGIIQYAHSTNAMNFYTGNTSRMSISSTGVVNISNNPYGSYVLDVFAGNVSHPQRNHFSGVAPNNTSYTLWYGSDEVGGTYTTRAVIWSNGNMQNVNGTFSAISDIKLKQDITDARSYWDDFKAVKFRKFRLKSEVEADADTPSMFGVIAQEIETVFPGLVYETPDRHPQDVAVLDEDGNPIYEQINKLDDDGNIVLDDDGNAVMVDDTEKPITEEKQVDLGTTTKAFKYSILSQIGLKVVQELQTRLEAAEAEIAILKG
jgi:hypothetical protein